MNRQLRRASQDLVTSLQRWQFWTFVGLQEVKFRYRRSVLGPFWITLSMAATIVGVGILYSHILKANVTVYLPYFSIGFILWAYVTGLVVEGCTTFINDGNFIRQLPAPLLIYQFRATWRAIIVFGHNIVIFVVIAIVLQIWSGWGYLEAAIGFVLLTINGTWMGLLLAIVCSRYRDIAQIVQSVMGILFFLTPIIWDRTSISPGLTPLAEFNPFYHLIEIVRGPLLGTSPKPISWVWAVVLALVGTTFTFWFFSRYRHRIAYWV